MSAQNWQVGRVWVGDFLRLRSGEALSDAFDLVDGGCWSLGRAETLLHVIPTGAKRSGGTCFQPVPPEIFRSQTAAIAQANSRSFDSMGGPASGSAHSAQDDKSVYLRAISASPAGGSLRFELTNQNAHQHAVIARAAQFFQLGQGLFTGLGGGKRALTGHVYIGVGNGHDARP